MRFGDLLKRGIIIFCLLSINAAGVAPAADPVDFSDRAAGAVPVFQLAGAKAIVALDGPSGPAAVFPDGSVRPALSADASYRMTAGAVSADGRLYAVLRPADDIDGGGRLWRVDLSDNAAAAVAPTLWVDLPATPGLPALDFDADGNLYFMGSEAGGRRGTALYRLSAFTGDVIAVNDPDVRLTDFAVADSGAVRYHGFDMETGAWSAFLYREGFNTIMPEDFPAGATPDDYRAFYRRESGADGAGILRFLRTGADPCDASLDIPDMAGDALLLKSDGGALYGWSQRGAEAQLTRLLPAGGRPPIAVADAAATAAPVIGNGALFYMADTADGPALRAIDLERGGNAVVSDPLPQGEAAAIILLDGGPEASVDGPSADVTASLGAAGTLQIAFSNPMDKASVERGFWLSMGGAEIPACKVWIGNSLHLIPEWDLMADALSTYAGEWTLSLDGAMDRTGRLLLDENGLPGLDVAVRLDPPAYGTGPRGRRAPRAIQDDLKGLAADLLGLSELTLGDFIPDAGGYVQSLAGGAFSIAAFQSEDEAWYMAATLKTNPSDFPFDSLYSQLEDILSGARLGELTLVSGEGEGKVRADDLPTAVKDYLMPFADDDGWVSLGNGVNFYGRITPDAGIFGQALDLILGPEAAAEGLKISGTVGYDLIREVFASQNVAANPPEDPADPVTQISLTIELPPIAPLPFSLTNNKEAMHLAFSETSLSIDYRTDGFDIAASRTVSLWLLNNRWINGAGDPIDIVNSLTVSFENNNLTKIQSSGSLGVNWENAFGLQGMTIKSLGLDGELDPAQSETGGLTVSAAVNIGDSPDDTTAEFGVSVEGNEITEVHFSLANIDLTRMPGIKEIPGVNEFIIDEISVGYNPGNKDVYLFGQTTWQRNGLSAALALLKEGDAFMLLLRVIDFNLGTLLPGIPAPYDTLGLPAGIVAISTRSVDDLTLGDLPEKVQEMFAGIKEKTEDALPIYDGVTLAAAIDLEALPNLMRQAVDELGLSDAALRGMGLEGPLVLAGSVGGIFSGTVRAALYMELPRITLPDALREGPLGQVVQFDSVVGKLFMRADLAATAVHFGLAGDLKFDLPRLVPDPSVAGGDKDRITLAGEVYVDMNAVGVGVKVAGYMDGTWNDPLGLKNFAFSNPAVMVGFDGEAALEFGIGGDIHFKARNDQVLTYGGTLALNLNFTSSIPIPKKFAIELKGSKMGAVAQMEIADALIRGAATGPMAKEVLPLLMDPVSKQAFQELQNQLEERSLLDIFQVDRLPLPMMELSDVNLYFATPGAVVPGRPGLDGMGLRVAGRLSVNFMGENHLIGEIDDALTLKEGLKLYGALGDFNLGPVGLTDAKLDLAAGIPGIHGDDVPRCNITGNSRVLFYNGALDIALSLQKARFFLRSDWGAFGYSELEAQSIGDSLLSASDFTVSFKAASNIYAGLRDEVKKGINDFLNVLDGRYSSELKAIETERNRLADLDRQIQGVKSDAWNRRVVTINTLNRNINQSNSLINHYRWCINYYWWKWWDHPWYYGQIAWHGVQIAAWRAAIWTADKFYQWEISLLNPKIAALEALKATAQAALDAASNLIGSVQQINRAVKAGLDRLVNEAIRHQVLVVNQASVEDFSLAQAVANPEKQQGLYLDLTLMGTRRIQQTVWFNLLHPANLFQFVGPLTKNLLNDLHGNPLGRRLRSDADAASTALARDHFSSPEAVRIRLLDDGIIPSKKKQSRRLAMPAADAQTWGHGAARTAEAPLNDAFESAEVLTGDSGWTTGSNVYASPESGEPAHGGMAAAASVWWQWIAPADGHVYFDTGGSDFDTLLAVYTGDRPIDLTETAANDDAPGREDATSRVRFEAAAGTTYWIAVDGYDGDGGTIELAYGPYEMTPPANDAFAGAAFVEGTSGTAMGTNVDASAEPGEPFHAGMEPTASVWWRWTAPESGAVRFDTDGSEVDTRLAVYTGAALDSLETVAANDDAGPEVFSSRVAFRTIAGAVYWIAVDGYDGDEGALRLHWEPYEMNPPANDAFADAVDIQGDAIAAEGGNRDASMETGEPNHGAMDVGASVWWRWTAPVDGGVCVDTAGSDFDTVLAVYTGAAVNDLALLAENDDDPETGDIVSRLGFSATAGQTYWIAVAGYAGAQGAVVLNGEPCEVIRPVNDDLDDAALLEGGQGQVEGSNEGAGRAADEPFHAGAPGGGSVWWEWTASEDGWVAFDTQGSDFDTLLAVYTVDSAGDLVRVSENDDASADAVFSRVRFEAAAGTRYLAAVDGFGGERGAIHLTYGPIDAPQPIANDDPETATVLPDGSGQAAGNNFNATTGPEEPEFSPDFQSAPVWWQWTAPASGWVVFDTEGSDFDTVMAVYKAGESGDEIVARNDDHGDAYSSRVVFEAQAGAVYRILVGGCEGDRGDIALNYGPYTPPAPPANDRFADAAAISGREGRVQAVNIGAAAETGEPDHGGEPASASIWYVWEAPADGGMVFSTDGSEVDTILSVYAGSALADLELIAENDDNPDADPDAWDYSSRVRVRVSAGAVYRIAVDGYEGDAGTFDLSWEPYAVSPPENDAFEKRIAIQGTDIALETDNRDASRQPGEPDHAKLPGGASIWYAWTAPASGKAAIDTRGSEADTLLAVYTGDDLAALSEVAFNDEVPDRYDGSSRVVLEAEKGKTYQIAVDGWRGRQGKIALSLAPYVPDPPENDDWPSAVFLSGPAGRIEATNVDAAAEPGEPGVDDAVGSTSVWWRWTPSQSGGVEWTTEGSGFDTVLTVYTGDALASLVPVAENDQAPGATALSSRVAFAAEAGVAYSIKVSGFSGAAGDIVLNWAPIALNPPENDAFANRIVLEGAPASATGSNVDAGREAGEPAHNSNALGWNSVWYAWTAAESGGVSIDTTGSGFDTLLAVYEGDALAALTPVMTNDNGRKDDGDVLENGASRIIFQAEAGRTYEIAVAGRDGQQGAIALNAAPYPYGPPPENDRFADRAVIPADAGQVQGTTRYATREAGEPLHADAPGQGSVWYTWTAEADGSLIVDSRESGFDTLLAVYTGNRLDALEPVAANADAYPDGAASVSLEVKKGTAYQIAVDGDDGDWGDVALDLRFTAAPDDEDTDDDDDEGDDVQTAYHDDGGVCFISGAGDDGRPSPSMLMALGLALLGWIGGKAWLKKPCASRRIHG